MLRLAVRESGGAPIQHFAVFGDQYHDAHQPLACQGPLDGRVHSLRQ
jgi:hypothetical protein